MQRSFINNNFLIATYFYRITRHFCIRLSLIVLCHTFITDPIECQNIAIILCMYTNHNNAHHCYHTHKSVLLICFVVSRILNKALRRITIEKICEILFKIPLHCIPLKIPLHRIPFKVPLNILPFKLLYTGQNTIEKNTLHN